MCKKMKKIVVNKCFGGYSLSPKAIKRMAELNGKECYFFKGGIGDRNYEEIKIENISNQSTLFFTAFTVRDPKNHLFEGRDKDGSYKSSNESYDKISLPSRPENRSNPILIKVVEELGDEANGSCAELEIVEIPEDVEYEIDEYDGIESIHEVHRSW